jgi:hypothetical protein
MSPLRRLSMGVSICLERVSRNSLNNFKTKVLIFDMVLIQSLYLNSFKTQVSTAEQFLTFAQPSLDSQEIIDSFKTQIQTVQLLLSLKQ